ncbi:MAG: DUF262 domain-containing protein [Ruminococcaceae bacterium]|nr:DUF262 domain-containing protein [Oscillospiraceae bacterium]
MDFKSGKKSIGGLFSCKKQFIIPRFQREYTWGKIELNEFLDDILSRVNLNSDGELDTSEYFWGSLLLVGDLDDQKVLGVDVVDGQQRITTMTIFLSVIAKLFAKEKEEGLSKALWEYVIGKDTNTEEFAVLKNETPKPFFQFIIQKLVEEQIEPKNTEEEKILAANKFFKKHLSRTGIKKRFIRLGKLEISEQRYVEILKVVRDQLLRSFVICISTTDEKYANMIFEILNAKGKELASVDLIKNAIFEKLDSEVPADHAKELWLSIRDNLCSRKHRVEFATFYRHFWIAYYGKVADNKLYADFQKKIKKTNDGYLRFLKEMDDASELYSAVLKPSLEDFYNKKEYNFFISEMHSVNDVFGIVQVRPVALSLLYLHKKTDILSYKAFKSTIKGLSAFHLMYNAISSKRTSSLETPLNNFAYSLHAAKSKEDIVEARKILKGSLLMLLPTQEDFIANFIELKFSKKNIPSNVLSKYILNKCEAIINDSDILEMESSIEHIKDEDPTNDNTLLIGNLLLLEQRINSSIPNGLELDGKKKYYSNSRYTMVSEFLKNTEHLNTWSDEDILIRCESLGEWLYDKLVDIVKSIV